MNTNVYDGTCPKCESRNVSDKELLGYESADTICKSRVCDDCGTHFVCYYDLAIVQWDDEKEQ